MLPFIDYDDDKHRSILGIGPMHHLPINYRNLWYPRDTEELFDKHWSDSNKRKLLTKYGWTKNSITYVRNDMGFRMYENFSEITPGECDFYLGCSITFGIGVNVEDTWGWQLAQKNGLSFVNLGWSGSGIDTQYRLLRTWAQKLKPRRAFTLGAYRGRRELFNYEYPGPNQLGQWLSRENKLYYPYQYLSNENELLVSMIRAFDAMKFVCAENNIELYTLTEDAKIAASYFSIQPEPLARDLMHPHPMWHNRIANLPSKSWIRLI